MFPVELTSEEVSEYYEQFSDASESSIAADALMYLGRIIWSNRNLRGKSAKEWCLQQLTAAPDLHGTLMQAHAARDFESLSESKSFASFSKFRLSPLDAIDLTLDDARPEMTRVVNGELTPTIGWKMPKDVKVETDVAQYLASLDIPCLSTEPDSPILLLHGLGTFGDDSDLCQRVDGIFQSGVHTFLVNTSGSGKTRLLFEGLCRYWGIYFTAVADTSNLGSNDITATYRRPFLPLPPRSPGSSYISPQVQVNQKTARRVYSEVLLARLLVFRLFASIASDEGEISEHHKQRWLLLQLRCSQLLNSDIFMTITKHLGGVDDAYIDEEIPQLLKDITKWCCSMPSGRNGLFIALDETNYAAKQHYSCFTDAGATYPILKEILRTWRERTKGADVTMVIAGTEIPRSIFKYESGEWDGFHWYSDTGGFDDEKSHECYISPYLPPSFRDSESGKDLIRRMWAWLRGRHRTTATVLTILLRTGFRCPHTQLDDYIQRFTRYTPDDRVLTVLDEPDIQFCAATEAPLPFSRSYVYDFVSDLSLRFAAHEVLLHYLVVGEHPTWFDDSQISLVSSSVGRMIDTKMESLALDEPLSVVVAGHWFTAERTGANAYVLDFEDPDYLDTSRSLADFGYTDQLVASLRHPHHVDAEQDSDSPGISPSIADDRLTPSLPQRLHGIAPYIALYIANAFDSTKLLSEVFTFPSEAPSWALQTAELVTIHGVDGEALTPIPLESSTIWQSTMPLATRAKSREHALAWLNHSYPTAFCIPFSPNSDLIFVLRLADKRLIWVVVHSEVTAGVTDSDSSTLGGIFTKLMPENMFHETDSLDSESSDFHVLKSLASLPGRCTEAGPYSLLRVLASFPSQVDLGKISNIDTISPVAALNTSLLNEVMATLSGYDLLKGIVFSALGKRMIDAPPKPTTSVNLPVKRPRVVTPEQRVSRSRNQTWSPSSNSAPALQPLEKYQTRSATRHA